MGATTTEALSTFLGVVAYLVPPVLVFLAYRAWRKSDRSSVRRWRNIVALVSLSLILVEWVSLLSFGIAIRLRLDTSLFVDLAGFVNIFFALAGTLMSLVMKGPPRLQAVAAGSLVTTIWVLSVSVV